MTATIRGVPTPEVVYTRGFLRKRPLLRLDEDGVEWAAGRVLWRDVRSISIVRHVEHDEEDGTDHFYDRVHLLLRLGRRPIPPSTRYAASGERRWRPELVVSEMELPLWTRPELVLAAFRRYYHGPFADEAKVRDPDWDATLMESFAREERLRKARVLRRAD